MWKKPKDKNQEIEERKGEARDPQEVEIGRSRERGFLDGQSKHSPLARPIEGCRLCFDGVVDDRLVVSALANQRCGVRIKHNTSG